MILVFRAVLETLGISVPTLFDVARGRLDQTICDQRLANWSERFLEQAGVSLHISGLEKHLDPTRRYVVMSNHQSHYDIPVLLQALSIPLRMLAMEELFRIPIWGQALRAAGCLETPLVGFENGRLPLIRKMEGPKVGCLE